MKHGLSLRWLLPLALFAAGCALAVHFAQVGQTQGETSRAAEALLLRGYIGDPFILPTGPSAHVSPVLAAYMAGVYALFGVDSRAANIALGMVAAGIFATGAGLTLRTLSALRLSPCASWLGTGLLLLTSFLLFYEVTACRVWEQPFSAVVLLAGWLLVIRFDATRGAGCLYAMAALAGLSFLLTAAIVPSMLIGLAMMLRVDWGHEGTVRRFTVSGLIVLAFVLPWGLRNELELGKFIITRSNFGLELAVGNQPGAQGPSSQGWAAPIHPSLSAAAAEHLKEVGEVAYMSEMTSIAWGWIEADPARFARLTARRAWLSMMPSGSMVGWFPLLGSGGAVLILGALGVLKLSACAASVALRRRPVQAIVFTVLPVTPYWVTHLYLRYDLLPHFTGIVLVALAADGLSQRFSDAPPYSSSTTATGT